MRANSIDLRQRLTGNRTAQGLSYGKNLNTRRVIVNRKIYCSECRKPDWNYIRVLIAIAKLRHGEKIIPSGRQTAWEDSVNTYGGKMFLYYNVPGEDSTFAVSLLIPVNKQ